MTITRHIAVVGGGPAATSFLRQLLQLDFKSRGLKLSVFERGAKIGPGLPYLNRNNAYILNLPIASMGLTPQKTGDFSRWISSRYHGGSQFPPRYYFGDYLAEVASGLPQEAKSKGISLQYHTNTAVTNIYALASGKYLLERSSEQDSVATEPVDGVVLCTGHPSSDTYRELIGKPGYYHNPWDDRIYHNLSSTSAIGVLGTRLTAIDLALRLRSSDHSGPIFMASRSGLLPAVLSKEIPPYTLKYVTLQSLMSLTKSGLDPLRIADVFDLIVKEIKEASGGEFDATKLTRTDRDTKPREWLEDQIAKAEAPKPWQQVLFALYPIMPVIWMMLEKSDKKIFMKHHYGTFLAYLAAFPLENAQRLQEMMASGQLAVSGGITGIAERAEGGYSIRAHQQDTAVDSLFNATGPGFNLRTLPLFQNMAEAIKINGLGGLKVNPLSLQVANHAGTDFYPMMFALGNPTFGDFLATSDMWQVSSQAAIVASTIANILNNRPDARSGSATSFWVKKAVSAVQEHEHEDERRHNHPGGNIRG